MDREVREDVPGSGSPALPSLLGGFPEEVMPARGGRGVAGAARPREGASQARWASAVCRALLRVSGTATPQVDPEAPEVRARCPVSGRLALWEMGSP